MPSPLRAIDALPVPSSSRPILDTRAGSLVLALAATGHGPREHRDNHGSGIENEHPCTAVRIFACASKRISKRAIADDYPGLACEEITSGALDKARSFGIRPHRHIEAHAVAWHGPVVMPMESRHDSSGHNVYALSIKRDDGRLADVKAGRSSELQFAKAFYNRAS